MKVFLKNHWAIILICICAAVVIAPKLDRPYFWQDEAETALLARSILKNGIPKAWDGANLITQLSGNDSNSGYVWSFTPWLPFYVVAASFKILGETNFSGRIPFVIIGLLALVSIYLLAHRLSKNRNIAALSALFLLLNMQFILYCRQCKYYSILFFVPPLLYLACRKIHKNTLQFVLFILFVIILFYTNYVSLFTSLLGLILYTFFIRREKRHIYSFIGAGVISLLLTLPFFLIGDFGASSTLISRLPSVAEYFDKLARHIWYFNNMAFGLILFVPLALFHKKRYFSRRESEFIRFLLWIILPAWIVLPLFNQDVFRYNLQLVPLLCVLSAFIVVAFFRWSKVWGAVFLILFLATNIFSNFPAVLAQVGFKASGIKFEEKAGWAVKKFNKDEYKTRRYFKELDRELGEMSLEKVITHSVLKSEYAAYVSEMTRDYPDAAQAVVDFFRENARPGDKIYSNFSQLSVEYYLPEVIFVNIVDPKEFKGSKAPPLPRYITSLDEVDWYFFRDVKMNISPYLTNDEFFALMKKRGKRLLPHDLGISSLYWDVNWPQRYYPYINKMLWHDERGLDDVVLYEVR